MNESLCSVKQESMDLTNKCEYSVDVEIIYLLIYLH